MCSTTTQHQLYQQKMHSAETDEDGKQARTKAFRFTLQELAKQYLTSDDVLMRITVLHVNQTLRPHEINVERCAARWDEKCYTVTMQTYAGFSGAVLGDVERCMPVTPCTNYAADDVVDIGTGLWRTACARVYMGFTDQCSKFAEDESLVALHVGVCHVFCKDALVLLKVLDVLANEFGDSLEGSEFVLTEKNERGVERLRLVSLFKEPL